MPASVYFAVKVNPIKDIKHEIYAAAFCSHLFYDLFSQAPSTPSDPLLVSQQEAVVKLQRKKPLAPSGWEIKNWFLKLNQDKRCWPSCPGYLVKSTCLRDASIFPNLIFFWRIRWIRFSNSAFTQDCWPLCLQIFTGVFSCNLQRLKQRFHVSYHSPLSMHFLLSKK